MRLLRAADVETTRSDRVFARSRVRAILWALIAMGACAALTAGAIHANRWLGYCIAAMALLVLVLSRRFITARFRPSNWLLRMNGQGVFIQFRSYLNYHVPADDLTVVFLPYPELRSARLVRERASVQDSGGRTTKQTFLYVELELAGETGALAKALAAESAERAPNEKRWYGTSSTLYRDYPADMTVPPFLRLRWQAVPRAERFLEALRGRTTIAEPVLISQDFAHVQGLSREEQQKRLRELAHRGKIIEAIYTARRLYGCGLEEARSIVEP